MKRIVLFISLFLNSLCGLSQAAFDHATFDALMNRYAQNPVNFLKTETAPDFVLTTGDGTFWSKDQTISLYDRLTQTSRSYENVVVRQYGNTGVATGILTHSYTSKASGQPSTLREAFTYVFNSPKSGTWQLVSGHHNAAFSGMQAENDAAVKAACLALSTHWDQRDLPALLADLANVPYASRYWPNNAINGSEAIRDGYTSAIKASPQSRIIKRETANWQLKALSPKYYWATYTQTLTSPDNSVKYEKEARLLEKINGEWKTVSNITTFLTKPD